MFDIRSKSRRKAGIGGFHAEYLNNRTNLEHRKQLGLTRTIMSSASLLLGGVMFYVALHYIPAFIQPRHVLKMATGDSAALRTDNFDRNSKAHTSLSAFRELFMLDRAYIMPGQSVDIKYDLPEGAHAKLDIVQCRRAWVIEIFNCDVVGRFSTETTRHSGVETFKLKEGGFYYFHDEAIGVAPGEPYRILWERGL